MSTQHTPKVGERFYYTGDVANLDGFGVVERIEETRWGMNIFLRFDDAERAGTSVTPASFEPGPGRRFWREVEYKAERAAKLAAAQLEYAKAARR